MIRRHAAPTPSRAGVAQLVADVTRPTATVRERTAALAALVAQLAGNARSAGVRAVVAGRWLSDLVTDVAPSISFRSAEDLRRQYPNLGDDAIADRLITTAARLSAAVGAAAGAMAAAEFVAPPALALAPVQLGAETLAVVAIELRLVAELHEIAGFGVPGSMRESAPAYLQAWVGRRAVTVGSTGGLSGLLGDAARRELRVRLLRRVGRSTATMAPFLAGAAAGAEINRRSTRDLGQRLRSELRKKGGLSADVTIDASAPLMRKAAELPPAAPGDGN